MVDEHESVVSVHDDDLLQWLLPGCSQRQLVGSVTEVAGRRRGSLGFDYFDRTRRAKCDWSGVLPPALWNAAGDPGRRGPRGKGGYDGSGRAPHLDIVWRSCHEAKVKAEG